MCSRSHVNERNQAEKSALELQMPRKTAKSVSDFTERADASNDSDEIRSSLFDITLSSIYEQFNRRSLNRSKTHSSLPE